MGTRIVHTETNGSNKVVVKYTSEIQEYVCILYKDDVMVRDSDYFTDDKQDAIDTAKCMVKDGSISHAE